MATETPFQKAFAFANQANLTHEEELLQHQQEDQWRYKKGMISYAYNKGLKEGLAKRKAEGLAKGKTEQALQTARNMLQEGLDAALISKVMGLSLEQIAEVKQNV